MFKLTIECSKDIKRLTLDFEDLTHSVAEFSDAIDTIDTNNQKLNEQTSTKTKNDFMDRLSSIGGSVSNTDTVKKELSSTVIIPDLQNRPPLVDKDFNESL